MHGFSIGLAYRQKLTGIIIGFTLVPMLAFFGLYFSVTLQAREKEVLEQYDRLVDRGIKEVAEFYRISAQKFDTLDKNVQLQMYLASRLGDDIMTQVDLSYSMNTLYETLRLGSLSSDIRVYSLSDKVTPLSFIREAEALDEGVRSRILREKAGKMLWMYTGTEIERFEGKGTMNFYKLNAGMDGAPLSIEEIQAGFGMIRRSFELVELPDKSFIVYLPRNEQPILIKNGGVDRAQLAMAVEEFRKGKGSVYYVLGRNLSVQIHPDEETEKGTETGKPFDDKGLKLSLEEASRGDRILLFLPRHYVGKKTTGFIVTAGFIFAGLSALIVVLVFTISKTLTRRLHILISEINRDVEKIMESDEIALIPGDDEFSRINRKFRELVGKIKEYYQEIASMETEKKALEVELLQELINPHFLYNALDGIKWASRDPRLSQVVDSMVRYYRIALNKGNKILKVAQELSMVEEYLKLQKFAYESDFRYVVDVEEEIKECQMLKHLLQPIVENAVLHGINKQGAEGIIRIAGRRFGSGILFEIEDNGSGMEEDKVRQILGGSFQSLSGGYGLMNVRRRVEMFYGKEYGLEIVSAPGRGTKVTLHIPCKEF